MSMCKSAYSKVENVADERLSFNFRFLGVWSNNEGQQIHGENNWKYWIFSRKHDEKSF